VFYSREKLGLNVYRKESPSTQMAAFMQIIALVTRYPRLRLFFLRFQDFENTANCEDTILAVWKREQDPGTPRWDFFSKLAAASIVKCDISTLMETVPPSELAIIDENGGAIEHLSRVLSC
jgi:hypothetical protein